MKIDTLSFIQHLLNNQGQLPSVFHPHAPVLVPAIITAVSDPFYKISSEALLVLESLVKVVRPLGSEKMNFDFRPYTDNIYQCCFVRLKASDIDQEVKERAISCMVRFNICYYFYVTTHFVISLLDKKVCFDLKSHVLSCV